MKRNTLRIILASTLLSSASYADISNITPASTASLSQIASSLSHSVSNVDNNINVETTTSNIINTADLKKDIKEDAEKFDLQVDADATEILQAFSGGEGSGEITEGIKDAKENVNTDKFGDDHVPTLDQDTILYDTGWMTLTKATSYDSKTYSSSNDVFDSSATQQARGRVYVNFKLQEISADVYAKITRTGGTEKYYEYNSGTATFDSVPIVAKTVKRFDLTEGQTDHDMFDGAQDTMLASNTTLQSSEFSTTQEMIDLYNHDTSDSDAESAIFTYGKFTTATAASVGLGSMAFEAGHAPDGANEATFAGTVERLEAEAVLVGKAMK